MTKNFRVEKDSMGELSVPNDASWGAQTQRAINNFPISGLVMPANFIKALALIKSVAASTNGKLGLINQEVAFAIERAANQIYSGDFEHQFPVDVFQTGSGTSTNMNMNEVIANIANSDKNINIHANDHVNYGQSSNDVIPAAIHLSSSVAIEGDLIPSLDYLIQTIRDKAKTVDKIVKTGRTHLMDAMPIRFDQELSGWAKQLENNKARLISSLSRLKQLPIGGTAIGTGINASPKYADNFIIKINDILDNSYVVSENYFEAISSQDTAVEVSGHLRTIAVSFLKIANDLRWMNSGPISGLSEISLPALQPGSSIMPGKVNPVIPESLAMVSAQVIGNDSTIMIAGQSGNFQLNVMLPVIAYNLLQSIHILSSSSINLADRAIKDFSINMDDINNKLGMNPILVTALNPVIGYDKSAAIAKKAFCEKRPILEVAAELTDLSEDELKILLDAEALTDGGIKS
ncbi:MAG: aspartate ammonia-lyase [Gammaproteobacteria bacterium TMED78]|nr:MAG: aspartate ammonia-lyase [Gammaproteobacteria bacterium TMED78]|tara:strand:+ start:59111 stop:60496 length:1386 start_codon:yes stop_codon:yes gene_type:complete